MSLSVKVSQWDITVNDVFDKLELYTCEKNYYVLHES